MKKKVFCSIQLMSRFYSDRAYFSFSRVFSFIFGSVSRIFQLAAVTLNQVSHFSVFDR